VGEHPRVDDQERQHLGAGERCEQERCKRPAAMADEMQLNRAQDQGHHDALRVSVCGAAQPLVHQEQRRRGDSASRPATEASGNAKGEHHGEQAGATCDPEPELRRSVPGERQGQGEHHRQRLPGRRGSDVCVELEVEHLAAP